MASILARRLLVFGVIGVAIVALALALFGPIGGHTAAPDAKDGADPGCGDCVLNASIFDRQVNATNGSAGAEKAANGTMPGDACPAGQECNGSAGTSNGTGIPPPGYPGVLDYDRALVIFWGVGCPECAEAKEFLAEMRVKYPDLAVTSREVKEDGEGLALMVAFCREHGLNPTYVPMIAVGGKVFSKFLDSDGPLAVYNDTGAYFGYRNQIEAAIADAVASDDGDEGREAGAAASADGLSLTGKADKTVYYSRDPIRVTATIWSDRRLDKYYLKIEGSGGLADYVRGSRWLAHIEAGTTEEVFDMEMPKCFGCANFQPGEYKIDLWLEKGGESAEAVSLDVEVRETAG